MLRTVYATTLTVNDPQDAKGALKLIGQWIQVWYERQRIKADWPEEFTRGFGEAAPLELVVEPQRAGHKISLRSLVATSAPGSQLIDIAWENPDVYDKTLGWTTRLAALHTPESLTVSLELAVKGITFQISPASIQLGAPRVIKDLARIRSVSMGAQPYNLVAEIISAEEMAVLTDLLLDQARPFPVVVVSRQLDNERPLVNSFDLAERLAGVAKVVELEDRWAGFALSDVVGKELSCYAGAVRIYWPRFSLTADPYRHQGWMPWSLREKSGVDHMADQIMAMSCEASAFRHVEPVEMGVLRAAAAREAREARREDAPADVDGWIQEIDRLEDLLEKANADLAELRSENSTLKDNVAALGSVSYIPHAPQAAVMPLHPAAEVEPKNVLEALNQAMALTRHLEYLPSATSSAEASPFKNPERALQALEAIDEVAEQWLRSIDTGKAVGSNRDLFSKLGFNYADGISQTSRGKWGDEYKVTFNGIEYDIGQHITIGGKQADKCLSIHMAFLKDERKVLVAHVGRHKTNTRS